jgi:predicted transcriptional regulator of viral defense system
MRSHEELARLASRQHGVVSFRQLREMGFSKGKIARSSEAFRRRVHRGVYAVGHARIEDMKLAGIDAIRITARRIERRPDEVGRRLRLHLERRCAELCP